MEQKCSICNKVWFDSLASFVLKDSADGPTMEWKIKLIEALTQAYGIRPAEMENADVNVLQICSNCSFLAGSLHAMDRRLKEVKRLYDDAKSNIDCVVIKSVNEDRVGEIYGEDLRNFEEICGGSDGKSLRLLIYQGDFLLLSVYTVYFRNTNDNLIPALF